MLRLDDNQIFQCFDSASAILGSGRALLVALKPPPGPYAIFHHRTHAVERIRDVRTLYTRLLREREELTIANVRHTAALPQNWPAGVPYPPSVCALGARVRDIEREMKVDYEAMFHFGSVLLDQVAYGWGYLCGAPQPEDFTFDQLVRRVEKDPLPLALRPLREHLARHARWLHFWLRTYRNRFVVHTNHPVQLGTIAGISDDRFCLYTPTAVGWNDDEAVHGEMRDLFPRAPDWLRHVDPEYWEPAGPRALFQRVIENIGNIEAPADRQRIASLAKRAGLETPTFQILASVLAEFIAEGSRLVEEAALTAPEQINIGRSPYQAT